MDKDNTEIEQLKALAGLVDIFDTSNIITEKEIEQVLSGITNIIASFKKENDKLNAETKKIVESLLERIVSEYTIIKKEAKIDIEKQNQKLFQEIEKQIEDKTKVFNKKIQYAEDLLENIKFFQESKETINEETIISSVLNRINIPTPEILTPETGETIVDKINSSENQIDASKIKNLPQPRIEGNFAISKSLYQLEDTNILGPVNGEAVVFEDGVWKNKQVLATVAVDGVTIFGNGDDIPLSAVTQQSGKYLLGGGASWSGTGYVFDVSILQYFFDGFKTSVATQTTLATADVTNNRFDAIVVDEAGTVTNITGTPSANPIFPTIPDDKLVVQYVLVTAGSTTPTITTDNIYLDNTPWTTSTWSGSSPLGSINFASTVAPKQGTLCAKATGVNNTRGMRFVRGTGIDLGLFAYVQIWVRLDVAMIAAKNLFVRFENTGGTLVGNSVNLSTYGMSKTIVGTWQSVVIPNSAFGAITVVKGMRTITSGSTATSVVSYSLDYTLLAGGILPQGALGPIYQSATNTLYTANGGLNGGTAVANSIFFGNNSGYGADGAVSSIFLGNNSGYNADLANNSIFIGDGSGYNGSSAQGSNFLGYRSGYNGGSAEYSNFFGYEAGDTAANAYHSNFFGYRAGKGAFNANDAIFIGRESGLNDTVDNGSSDYSILLGRNTSTGGFSNSIAIGRAAVNTSTNQLMVGSSTRPVNDVTIFGTGGIKVPVGTTGERIAVQGMVRYNTSTSKFEGYDGTTWQNFY
jgi:hypothetical protein